MLAVDTVFTPKMDEEQRNRLYETWKKAVERSKNWETNP
jgi:glycerol kinase